MGEIARVVCRRGELPELSADERAAFWQEREPIALLDTVSGRASQQATRVRLAWNSDEIRVLFCVEDTHIFATLTEHDAPLYAEEVVEVFLDPAGDHAAYFEIELNPLNAVLDLVLRRNRSGYQKNFAWNCDGLRTFVRRDDAGWSGELAIPFRSVAAAPPNPGDTWSANFTRIDRPPGRPRELSAWSVTGFANFHVPQRFGAIEFQ